MYTDHYKREYINEKAFQPYTLNDYIKWEGQVKRSTNNHISDIQIKNTRNIKINDIEDLNFKELSAEIAKIELEIKIDNKSFNTKLSTQMLHQLCTRMWKKIKKYEEKGSKEEPTLS